MAAPATEVKEPKDKVKTLPWKYCECGCSGAAVHVGPLPLWRFNDLLGGFHLYRGHGHSGHKIGQYTSAEKADEAARRYAKPHFERMKKEVEELGPAFEFES